MSTRHRMAPKLGAQGPRPTAEHVDAMTADAGWMRPLLFGTERACWGRWAWWMERLAAGELGDSQIPQLPWTSLNRNEGPPIKPRFAETHPELAQEIGTAATAKGRVMGTLRQAAFSTGTHAGDIVDWLLWAFGSPRIQARPNLQGSAAVTIYHELRLEDMLAWPGDWGSEIIRELISETYGQRSGWFATPIEICSLMTTMIAHDAASEGRDQRTETLMEPCCGTGAMLWPASNYYLRIYANDIDRLMVRLTELVAWLFVPWLIRPAQPGEIREFDEADRARAATQDAATTAEPTPSTAPTANTAEPPRRKQAMLW